jgi:hypothetical protein
MAVTVVYQGETTPLTVVEVAGHTYSWELYDDGTVNFATVPGNCPVTSANFVGSNSGASVNVKWMKAGIYFFKVTALDAAGCAMNFKIGMLEVKEAKPTAVITPPIPDYICNGETASLEIIFTGEGPWDITYTDGTNFRTVTGITESPYLLKVSPNVPTMYRVTEVKNVNGTNTEPSDAVWLIVNPKPVSSKIYLYEP